MWGARSRGDWGGWKEGRGGGGKGGGRKWQGLRGHGEEGMARGDGGARGGATFVIFSVRLVVNRKNSFPFLFIPRI